MDKVIATVLLTISAVIAATLIATSTFPMLQQGTSAMASATATMESRIKTSVSVVHASGDPDLNELYIWVKNIGAITVDAAHLSDLFLQTPDGTYDRLSYGAGANQWQYTVPDGGDWSPGKTIKITVALASVSAGEYRVILITPNGVGAQTTFSV